ncbi:MAG: hypothetical protein U0934_06260 [Pseudotabrizicola sp.]|uniref:hypothetical protein n=1 Tax=Pseudotabrizicola sp. TaxID=2939647 RepID=UPI002726B610|nr:hypothetical protein [Pseudotabrizicola sp.]MDO8885142.1 hypothetical protein [Pseudotabrizicola sp.]MDP2082645.1 hypothetical protein [Pseudotabrizicola sp.]MDZ7573541.1 hypothetical protein [Pseudotabrizicola sp.]
MSDFIQELADSLARDVLDGGIALDDPYFYEKVAKVVGASSPTLQEVFMTSIRIRLAEKRGREFLEKALAAKRAGQKLPEAPREAEKGGH